jgi:hypothetical protein
MPGETARSDPRPSVRVTRGAVSGQHLASVLQEGRKNANIDAGLGFIWRISVSRFKNSIARRLSTCDNAFSTRADKSCDPCHARGEVETNERCGLQARPCLHSCWYLFDQHLETRAS